MLAVEFFELPESLREFRHFFSMNEEPWKWLEYLEQALIAYGETHKYIHIRAKNNPPKDLSFSQKAIQIGKNVHIGEGVKLPVTCTIEDNVYIGEGTEIRSGALIRKNVIIGAHCVIGNSCEIKHSLLMDHVQVAHFNYVGDSVLGSRAHLSAGAILSNLRFDQQPVKIRVSDEKIETGLRKFGAILGKGSQVGCNSVLLPGSILGKNSIVSAGMTFGGVLEENKTIYIKQEYTFK